VGLERIPAELFALYQRWLEKFPIPSGEDPGPRQLWLHRFAEQACFSLGSAYGHKRAGSGRPHSEDVIARNDSRGFIGWDLVIEAGTSRQRPCDATADGIDLGGQVFEAVQPVDHLAGSNGGGGEETPSKLVELLENMDLRLSILTAQHDHQEASLAVIESKLDVAIEKLAHVEKIADDVKVTLEQIKQLTTPGQLDKLLKLLELLGGGFLTK